MEWNNVETNSINVNVCTGGDNTEDQGLCGALSVACRETSQRTTATHRCQTGSTVIMTVSCPQSSAPPNFGAQTRIRQVLHVLGAPLGPSGTGSAPVGRVLGAPVGPSRSPYTVYLRQVTCRICPLWGFTRVWT